MTHSFPPQAAREARSASHPYPRIQTMPDSIHAQSDDQPLNTTRADGWAIVLAKRARFGGGEIYDIHYFTDWPDAQDCYEHPPGDWQSTAIFACEKGEPTKKLSAYRIGQLRADI